MTNDATKETNEWIIFDAIENIYDDINFPTISKTRTLATNYDVSKDKQTTKSKSKLVATKKDEKDKNKGKGNKKQQDVELFEWSRTSHVIGTANIDCIPLLFQDTASLNMECLFQRQNVEPHFQTTTPPTSSLDESLTKKTAPMLEPKKKPVKDIRRASSRSVSAMKPSRMKGNKGDISQVADIDQGSCELEEAPLCLNFTMDLLRWNTAMQGLLATQNGEHKKTL